MYIVFNWSINPNDKEIEQRIQDAPFVGLSPELPSFLAQFGLSLKASSESLQLLP